jgi:hypothetical protein
MDNENENSSIQSECENENDQKNVISTHFYPDSISKNKKLR